jgi:hypothetical protein
MGRTRRNTCSAYYRKLVWKDGYNESKGLPSASAGIRIPSSCGKGVLKKAWHAGYNAGEQELKRSSGLLSPEAVALSGTALDVAAKIAREVGVDGGFADQLAKFAKFGLSFL